MTRRTVWIVVGIVAGAALAWLVNRAPMMWNERTRETPTHAHTVTSRNV